MKDEKFNSSGWNASLHSASLIVKDAPLEYLKALLPLDGINEDTAVEAKLNIPSSFYGFGLCDGSPSPAIMGPGLVWPTKLGQYVIDMLVGRISPKFPHRETIECEDGQDVTALQEKEAGE